MNIIPSYACNLRCPFCFNKDQWDNNSILDLNFVKDTLNKIKEITCIVIIGGEPSILQTDYLSNLLDICIERMDGTKPIVYTNLIRPFPYPEKAHLFVSYDPCNRKLQNIVLNNMLSMECNYTITMLVTKELIRTYGINRIIKLARRTGREIHLEMLDVCQDPIAKEMLPAPKEIVEFAIQIATVKNVSISFSLTEYLTKQKTKGKASFEDFDNDISLIPDGTYQLSSSHGIKKYYADTYDDAWHEYNERHKIFSVCNNCKYNHICLDIYRIGNQCNYDFELMEALNDARDNDPRIVEIVEAGKREVKNIIPKT